MGFLNSMKARLSSPSRASRSPEPRSPAAAAPSPAGSRRGSRSQPNSPTRGSRASKGSRDSRDGQPQSPGGRRAARSPGGRGSMSPKGRKSPKKAPREAEAPAPPPGPKPLFPPGEKPSLAGFEKLLTTKQSEVDMLMTQNEQLRLSMDKRGPASRRETEMYAGSPSTPVEDSTRRLERELGGLADALAAKDRALRAAQATIDNREHEIRQLSVVQSQSEGKDEAMKIAARQNREILRILQEASFKCTKLEAENAKLSGELQRCNHFNDRRMRRSTQQNERLRSSLKMAQKEITVNVLAKLSCDERAREAEKETKETKERTAAEIELHREELNDRRQKQYLLTSELLLEKDKRRRIADEMEGLAEDHADEAERAEELDARLALTIDELGATESRREELRNEVQKESQRANLAERRIGAADLRADALLGAFEATVAERKEVRAWKRKSDENAAAANATAAAAEAAAKRSLQRHVDTLTLVRTQKKEIGRLSGQLGRRTRVLERTRRSLCRELTNPKDMPSPARGRSRVRLPPAPGTQS